MPEGKSIDDARDYIPPIEDQPEPTDEDIAANRLRLKELRARVDRMTTPKAIVLSGYTVLGLANAVMVKRNLKAAEEWHARRTKAHAAGESWKEEEPAATPVSLEDMGAGVEARIAEALHEVVKALTMQSAADKGARHGLEQLMAQLMTDADVQDTKVRSLEQAVGALRRIADPDELDMAEAIMAADQSPSPPTDNDADLAQAIGDI